MNRFTRSAVFAGLSALAIAAAAIARPGTITSGDATFQFATTGASAATITNANLRPGPFMGGNLDYATQNWWWLRINSALPPQQREFAFPDTDALTGESYVGNTATLRWTGIGTPENRFDARLVCVLDDGPGATACRLEQRMTITNTGTRDLNISLFAYADLDANGSALMDTASLIPTTNFLRLRSEESGTFVDFSGFNAAAYQATTGASVMPVLRNLLNDVNLNNLANSGVPFGPSDSAFGLQFNLNVPVGESRTVLTRIFVNAQPPACPGDLDGDGLVGLSDIAIIVNNWGASTLPGLNGDADGDGSIGLGDIAVVVQNWGANCTGA